MAKINGIELKNAKKFLGHEEEPCYQGNLYVGGKKVAFWSQDSHGGIMDNVSMEREYSERKLRKCIHDLNKEKDRHGTSMNGQEYTIEYDLENLMPALLDLKEDEKQFKSALKKGYAGIVVIKGSYKSVIYSVSANYLLMTEKELKEKLADGYNEVKKACFKGKYPTFHVYKSIEDFTIGEPIALSDIAA